MTNLVIKCPTCDRAVAWTVESKFRPFCSDRCRLIDLGEWADGNRAIPMDPDHDDVMESDLSVEDLP